MAKLFLITTIIFGLTSAVEFYLLLILSCYLGCMKEDMPGEIDWKKYGKKVNSRLSEKRKNRRFWKAVNKNTEGGNTAQRLILVFALGTVLGVLIFKFLIMPMLL